MHLNNIAQKFVIYRKLTMCFYVATLGVFVFWGLTRPGGFNVVVFCLQAVPLLLLLPGLLSQYYRVYSWLCFVILLYFVVAVMGVFASTAKISDYVFLASTVVLFIVSMMCSRYAQRVQKGVP